MNIIGSGLSSVFNLVVFLCCIFFVGGWCSIWIMFFGYAVMYLYIGMSFIFGASLVSYSGLKDMIDEFFFYYLFYEKGSFFVVCWSMYYFSSIFSGVGSFWVSCGYVLGLMFFYGFLGLIFLKVYFLGFILLDLSLFM